MENSPAASTDTKQLDPFQILLDYERRSLAHNVGLSSELIAAGVWRGVAYRIGQRRLVSRYDEVLEIVPLPSLTSVPGAQPWMLGVANIRGNLMPAIDLKQFLEGEKTQLHDGQRVLIVQQRGGNAAIVIDELYGQRNFTVEQEASAELIATLTRGRYGYFINRGYQVGEQLWGVFSFDRLARTPEFRQAAA